MFYILSAANTVGIIRSTVSITFIINLDEMFYNAIVSNTMKKSITDTSYEIKHSRLWCACACRAALRQPLRCSAAAQPAQHFRVLTRVRSELCGVSCLCSELRASAVH